MSTLYDVLGVRPDAEPETVKRAFRSAVKAHHPDVSGGDATASERIKVIIAAYDVLRDPEQRAAYDQELASERAQSWSEWRRATLHYVVIVTVLSAALISAAELWINWTSASTGAARWARQRVFGLAAVRPDPDLTGSVSEEARPTAGSPSDAASALAGARQGNIAAAEAKVDFSIIDELAPAAPLPTTASSYLERATDWSNRGDLDRAIADLDQAIQLAPDDAQAYRSRGNAWGHKGDIERALADYEQAIRIDPNNPAVFHDRGLMWQQNGELDKALVDLDRSVRMSFADPELYSDRGAVWLNKGRYDRALADFDQAIRINPHLASAQVRRAVALDRKADQERGHVDAEQAPHPGGD